VGASARKIARAVQRGDTTATQVVADHIDHARLADRVLAALRVRRDAAAIVEAELVDEQPDLGVLPLAGVPIAIGEDTPIAGTWPGPPAVPAAVAGRDHEAVRRLRGAGAIVIGTGRTSEFGLWPATDDSSAITRNPWRSDRGAGGAAGGAAAAVAAGIVPLAHAVDGLGSVRVPAACCGVLGLKPGRGLIDDERWLGLAAHGLLATTVDDLALAFAALRGGPAAPPRAPLRIAVSLRAPVPGVQPDPEVRAAVALAARTLIGRGHAATAADPPYPARLALMTATTWSAVASRMATDAPDLQPRTRTQVALGRRALRHRLVREGERVDWRERCLAWFRDRGYDVLLLPVLPTGAPPAAYWSERGWRANVAAALRVTAYTAPWNLAGLPALSVPCGRRADGMPAAVQLVGPPGAEATLLALASVLAEAVPWSRHASSWPRDPQRALRERTAAYPTVAVRSAE
jgi:amidase